MTIEDAVWARLARTCRRLAGCPGRGGRTHSQRHRTGPAQCATRLPCIVHNAGLDATAWTPRELRHSFVSILSDSGVPLEQIARLLGHSGTAVTERIYRHQLRPVLEEGTATMDSLLPSDDAG